LERVFRVIYWDVFCRGLLSSPESFFWTKIFFFFCTPFSPLGWPGFFFPLEAHKLRARRYTLNPPLSPIVTAFFFLTNPTYSALCIRGGGVWFFPKKFSWGPQVMLPGDLFGHAFSRLLIPTLQLPVGDSFIFWATAHYLSWVSRGVSTHLPSRRPREEIGSSDPLTQPICFFPQIPGKHPFCKKPTPIFLAIVPMFSVCVFLLFSHRFPPQTLVYPSLLLPPFRLPLFSPFLLGTWALFPFLFIPPPLPPNPPNPWIALVEI